MSLTDAIGRKLLFSRSRAAHSVSIAALRCGLRSGANHGVTSACRSAVRAPAFQSARHGRRVYDKNAEVPDALLGLGFRLLPESAPSPRWHKPAIRARASFA